MPRKTYLQAVGSLNVSRLLTGLTTLASFSFWVAILLVIASLIPDFCDFPPPGVLAVPHVIWAIAPLITYYFFSQTLYFGPYFQLKRINRQTWFFLVILGLDAASHIVHLVFTIIEVARAETPLYNNTNSNIGFAFLIVLLAILGVWIIVDIWLFVRVVVYQNELEGFFEAGWRPGCVSSPKEAVDIARKKSLDNVAVKNRRSRYQPPQTAPTNAVIPSALDRKQIAARIVARYRQ